MYHSFLSAKLWLGLFAVLTLAISTVWLGNNLNNKTSTEIYAAGETVNISLLPNRVNLPPNSSTQLTLAAMTNRIAAVNIEINFDTTRVQLASEVAVGTALPYMLPGNTTMAQANASGRLIIHLGKTPGNPVDPTGTFSVATVTWTSATTQNNVTTQVSINTATSTVTDNSDPANPQYVPITASPLTVNINVVNTPTPTPRPTNTPTPRPTNIPTPRPTSTPVPTATPTPRPTNTPTPRPTNIPTPRPTSTPVPTATPTPRPTNTPTPRPTNIPTPRPTSTPVPTGTSTPPTPTRTPTATLIPVTPTSIPPTGSLVIRSVQATRITQTTAEITWFLSGYGTGQVEYGTTTAYGLFSKPDTSSYWFHIEQLTNLTPNTLYHYRVISSNISGQKTVSADHTFTTKPPILPTPILEKQIFTAVEDKTIGVAGEQEDTQTLKVDNSPMNNFLMKFNITGLNGRRVNSAMLRVYCTDGSLGGGRFYSTTNNWSEESLAWNNAPPAFTLLGYLGFVYPGRWYQVNVTGFVRGEGTYSFRATSFWWDAAAYSSSEGNQPPQLVITY